MEMPKDKTFIVFSQRFCYEYSFKTCQLCEQMPPVKTIWCLSQANLGPAPSLDIVAWLEILPAAFWFLCRTMERLQDALMDRLTPKSMTLLDR